MKPTLQFIFLGAIFISSAFAITNENQLRVMFNNGVLSPGMSCNSADWVQVLKAVSLRRRFLRQTNDTLDENIADDPVSKGSARKLPVVFYPASCKTSCLGFAPGTCVAPACKGYRRDLDEATAEQNNRDLQSSYNDAWCSAAQNAANICLDALARWNVVTPSCVNLLNAPRKMDCLVVTC
jgi:hypothetical protein